MKRLFLLIAVLTGVFVCNAQSIQEQMASIDALCIKLSKALDKTPKETNDPEVDRYVAGCVESATGAVANVGTLQEFYKREIGETVDGVTDVTITKPSLEDWIALGAGLALQVKGAADLNKSAEEAAKAVKAAPKMKAIGLSKATKWSNDLLLVTTDALNEEAKAVNQIIETLKSGQNL